MAALIRDGTTRAILRILKPTTCEQALEELKKYESEIAEKSRCTPEEILSILHSLPLTIIPLEQYSQHIKTALDITPDPNDVDFIALCIHLNATLWTNDSKLKQQNKVQVLTTTELIDALNQQQPL